MQSVFLTIVGDADRSFYHGNARSFQSGIHGKHSTGDCHAAVWSLHIKVPRAAFCSLDQDGATAERDGCVLASSVKGELASLADFHDGAVVKLYERVPACGGTHHIAFQ